MKRRTRTPWKKSRTYGDIHGGRQRSRFTDNIFARAHSLQRAVPGQTLPILLQDNPSRDFHFPVSAEEFAQALQGLPESHRDGITHIWLRRATGRHTRIDAPLAEFICGSGVRVVVIYPWRVNGRLCLGRSKPTSAAVAEYQRFGGTVFRDAGRWYAHLTGEQLRRFYVEHLFCHEVGHHVDWYGRQWSRANGRQVEDFADQYAVQWGPGASASRIAPD